MRKLQGFLLAAALAAGISAAPAAAAPVHKHVEATKVVKTVKVDPFGRVIVKKDVIVAPKFDKGFRSDNFHGHGFTRRGFAHGAAFKQKSLLRSRFQRQRFSRKGVRRNYRAAY